MHRWIIGMLVAWLVVGMGRGEAKAQDNLYMQGWHLYRQGAYMKAIEVLRQARRRSDSPAVTYLLSQSYIRLGDDFGRRGDQVRQRLMYQRALAADPMLIYDEGFMSKYRLLSVTVPRPPQPKVVPLPSYSWNHKAHTPRDSYSAYLAKQRQLRQLKKELKELNRRVKRNRNWQKRHRPRQGRWFGIGFTLGMEGVLALQVNLMLGGFVNFSASFSPFFQTIDGSVKLMILPFKWTPYFGAGYVRSFSENFCDYHFIRADAGVMFTAANGFTLTIGISIPFQRTRWSDEFRLFTIPIVPNIQWAWYF